MQAWEVVGSSISLGCIFVGQEKEILFKAGKLLKTWILANGKKKKYVEIEAQKDFDKLPYFRIHEFPKTMFAWQIKHLWSNKHIEIMFKAKPHLHDEHWNIALNKGQFLELNENPGMQNNMGA